ncbi:MAG: TetR/AcrR family transcriptional regulator [Candidatus Hydrogenedentota bacterium]
MSLTITKKARRGRPKDAVRFEAKKREILRAAAQCFGKYGYAQTDVNLIAQDIGITKGTIYHYFGSKEKLFFETVDAEALRMKTAVLEAADQHEDPLEEMIAVVRSYLEFAEANPHFVELLIEERSTFKDRDQHTYFIHRDTTLPRWHRSIELLIQQGRARSCDPEKFIAVLSDTLYGTIFANYFTHSSISAVEQSNTIIDIVFNGILIEPLSTH